MASAMDKQRIHPRTWKKKKNEEKRNEKFATSAKKKLHPRAESLELVANLDGRFYFFVSARDDDDLFLRCQFNSYRLWAVMKMK